MRRSRFAFRVDVRVTWPMIALCAGIGMLPIAVGWATYMLSERALDIREMRR